LILDGSNGLSDVDGTAATPAIRGTDTNTGIFFPAADTIAFSEGGTEVMRIDSAGRITQPFQPAFFASGTGGSISVSPGSYFPFNTLYTTFCSSARSGGYNTGTFLYTAPVAGLYVFYVQLYCSSAHSTSWWKNGAQLVTADAALASFNNNTNTYMYNGSVILELAAGDFVGAQPRTGSGTQSIYMGHSSFWGSLIG
jgi:hypothetical protein